MIASTELIRRNTVSQMVDAYTEACREIKEGFELLAKAEARLKAAFDGRIGFEAITRYD